jgi:hypothetical protein
MPSNSFRKIALGVEGHSVKFNSYGQPNKAHCWRSLLLPVEANGCAGQLSGILEAREEEARVQAARLMKKIA